MYIRNNKTLFSIKIESQVYDWKSSLRLKVKSTIESITTIESQVYDWLRAPERCKPPVVDGSISLETARNGEFGDLPRGISSSPEGNLQPLWETLFSIKASIKSLIRLIRVL